MEKRQIKQIIILSENETEKCYYEITAEKVVFNREASVFTQTIGKNSLTGWQKDSFELNISSELWDHILHYNLPIISNIEDDCKVGKDKLFTVKLELTTGEKLERIFSGRVAKIGFGLLTNALVFPQGFNKPFWAK